MESEDQKKKPYSPPAITKTTAERARKLLADRKRCSEGEASDFFDSLLIQHPNNATDQKTETLRVNDLGKAREQRRHQRLEIEVEVIVRTDSELLPGRTHDISEFGMSAILPVELREGQEVELQIRFPQANANTRAIVRHRNVFSHGFEFVQPLHGVFSKDVIADGLDDRLGYFDLSRTIFPSN